MSAGGSVHRVVVKTSYQAKKTRGLLTLRLNNPDQVIPLYERSEIIKSGREIIFEKEMRSMEGVKSLDIKFQRTFYDYPMKTKIDYISIESSGGQMFKFCGYYKPVILWNKSWTPLTISNC